MYFKILHILSQLSTHDNEDDLSICQAILKERILTSLKLVKAEPDFGIANYLYMFLLIEKKLKKTILDGQDCDLFTIK